MQKFIIEGGKALYGSVRLGGAKNASSKIMIASLLSKGESRLLNFSHIDEIEITKEIVQSLGGTTRNAGERTLFIASDGLSGYQIPEKYGKLSRASTLFIPPLLARFQKAVVPFPGGDLIGKRPLIGTCKVWKNLAPKFISIVIASKHRVNTALKVAPIVFQKTHILEQKP